MLWLIRFVFESCITVPLRLKTCRVFIGSFTNSLGTMNGPSGPNVLVPRDGFNRDKGERDQYIIKDGQMHAQAGAGIVADSDPAAEIKESWVKARPLLDDGLVPPGIGKFLPKQARDDIGAGADNDADGFGGESLP